MVLDARPLLLAAAANAPAEGAAQPGCLSRAAAQHRTSGRL